MRKRRCVRCVLGILLSVCMIFGMVWLPEGSQAEASNDTMEVTFYKTGRWQSVSGTRIVTESDLSTYAGYCKATVLLDGKEQLVDWQIAQAPEPTKGNENRWSLVSRQDTGNGIPSGTKSLIIPKETVFYKTDGTPILQAGEDFALTYAGNYTDWPEGFTDAAFTMRWIGDQENGDTYVALNVDKNICDLSTVYSSGDKFSSTVLVNGEERAVTWQYIYDGTNQLIRSDYSVDSVNYIPSDATEIEIAEGAFLISATGTKKPIRITKGIVLTEVGGSWVEGCMNMGLAFAAVYPQTDFLQVQFTYDADLSKIAESTCYVYLDTEIDGEIVKNVRWVINKSVGKIYPDGTAPTVPATAKSVKIHAGIYSGGYSGTSCTAPIRITNDVGAVYVSGAWQDALAVRSVNASYYEVVGMSNQTPQIKLTVDVVTTDEWKGWFNGKAYVGDQEVNARFYFEPNTQTLLVGQNVGDSDPSDNVMKALKDHKTVKIKAQGELSPVQGQPGSIVLNLAEDLTLSWNGSEYISGESEPREFTTNVRYRSIIEGTEAYQLHLIVDKYNELVNEYGLWSWFEGKIKVNGEERTVAFQLGSNLFATLPSSQNANAGLPVDTTSIEIPEETIFTDVDGSSANPLKIINRLSYVKKNGIWYAEGQVPKEILGNFNYRDILEDDGAYRLQLTVDNYEELVEEFGLWSWFEGKIKVNGEERTVAFNLGSNVFATFPSKQNANAGISLDATSIEIPAGTIFKDKDYSSANLLKVTHTIALEKDPVYGHWGLKGTATTPTKFNEIEVNVHTLTGVYIALGAQTKKNWLADIYGSGARFYGAATIGDPDKGVYTNKNTLFYLSGDQLVSSNVQVGLMDSLEIKAGTILWPGTGSKCQDPIRIMTDVLLTRDSEDDWVIQLNGKTVKIGEAAAPSSGGTSASSSGENGASTTGKNSPQTGDDTPLWEYMGILMIAFAGVGICTVCGYRSKRNKKITYKKGR